MNWIPILLIAASNFALRMSQWSTSGQWWQMLIWSSVQCVVLLLLKLGWDRWTSRGRSHTNSTTAILIAGALNLAVMVTISGGWATHAVEEQLVIALISVAAGLYVIRSDDRAAGQVAMISGIAIICLLPGIPSVARTPLIVTTIVIVSIWLSHLTKNALSVRALFWPGLGIFSIIMACAVSHFWIRPTDGNPWYAAWVPSSGGDGTGDASARRGVGDGPDEINTGQATSVGFDQSNNFSESGKDGLYDLWIEAYGEPVKPGESQKMIGLKPNDVKVVQSPDRENLRVGRQFEMQRKPTTQQVAPQTSDVAASARIWVTGPMPAYIRMATFDAFDGLRWREEPHGQPSIPARLIDGWFEILDRPLSPAFGRTNSYQIKVGDIGGVVLPMPPSTERFKMGRVSRPDFFSATRPGLIRMARRSLPPGATLEVQSKQINPGQLAGVHPALPKHAGANYLDTSGVDPRVQELAESWAGQTPRGWRQIELVIHGLHDRVRVIEEENHKVGDGNAVERLLFGSGIGHDYEIATTACLLLRSLSYPTRLVSGLYADERHVDRNSGFAPMNADHTHFWIEIQLADGTWVSVDPTPGYSLLNIPKSSGEWAAGLWKQFQVRLTDHVGILILVVPGLIGLFLGRRAIIDWIATSYCRLRGCHVLHTLHVIELRCRLAGCARPAHVPVARWLRTIVPADSCEPFIQACNHLMYASVNYPLQHHDLGRRALLAVTRKHLHIIRKSEL